jgi:hypothetical protein
MTHRFDILRDWLGFADTEEIQQAVRTLIAVMGRHEDASSSPICRTAWRRAAGGWSR